MSLVRMLYSIVKMTVINEVVLCQRKMCFQVMVRGVDHYIEEAVVVCFFDGDVLLIDQFLTLSQFRRVIRLGQEKV